MNPDSPALHANPRLLAFDCAACGASTEPRALAPVCPACGKPLVARYDLERIAATVRREALGAHGAGMWRYLDVLPLAPESVRARLGEGGTPLVPLPALARALEL